MVQLTFAVVAEGHLGLAEANSVLARSDAIELLKLGLVYALQVESLEENTTKRGARDRGSAAVASA